MLWTVHIAVGQVGSRPAFPPKPLTLLSRTNDDANPELANAWKQDDDGGVVSDQPRVTVGGGEMCGPTGGYITKWVTVLKNSIYPLISRITNDAREDEMDENVQQVSTMVGNLRNMAIDMSTEVSNQNRQLTRYYLLINLIFNHPLELARRQCQTKSESNLPTREPQTL